MNVNILWCFLIEYAEGWGFKEHTHDFFQLFFAVEGSATFIINNKEYLMQKNDCALIPPGVRHEMPPKANGLLRFVDTKFRVSSPTLGKALRQLPALYSMRDPAFHSIQRRIRDEWVSNMAFSREMANSFLEQGLYMCVRNFDHRMIQASPYNALEKMIEGIPDQAKPIVSYLADHYTSNLSLDSISESLGYSKSHLCRTFKSGTGLTINAYINYLRINKAAGLLKDTDTPIKEISETCGFSSIHYFSRLFKKLTTLSPVSFRDRDKVAVQQDINSHSPFKYRYYDEEKDSAP